MLLPTACFHPQQVQILTSFQDPIKSLDFLMNLFQPDIHLYSQMNWVGFRLGRIKLSSAKENTSPIPALRSRISAPPSLVSVSKWWFNFSLLTYVKEQQTQTNKFNIRTPYLKKIWERDEAIHAVVFICKHCYQSLGPKHTKLDLGTARAWIFRWFDHKFPPNLCWSSNFQ